MGTRNTHPNIIDYAHFCRIQRLRWWKNSERVDDIKNKQTENKHTRHQGRRKSRQPRRNKKKKIRHLPFAMYLLKIAQALTSRRYRSPDLFSAALKSVTSNQKRRQKSNVLFSLELLKTKQTEIYIDRLDNPGLFILERPLDPGGCYCHVWAI